MSVVTRRIQCHECGAPHQVLDDALLVVCDRCGSFVALRSEARFGGESIARRHAQGIRALVEPTAAESRKLRAQLAMADAQAAGDHESWRLWGQEYYAVLPVTDPELVPGDRGDPRAVARWVRASVEAAFLGAFDPGVRAAQAAFAAAAGRLYRAGDDPISVSREVLRKGEALQRAITEHPRYPRELATSSPARLAEELLRSTLVGAASLLGPGVVTRIRREVLGDEEVDAEALGCPGCGAALPAAHGDQRCPYCGAVLHVQTEDPWVSNLVGLWQASRHQSKGDDDEALLALTLTLSSRMSGGPTPPTEAVWRFLAAGPGWLPTRSLERALGLMRHGYGEDPEIGRWLDALHEELPRWVPQGERPAATDPLRSAGPRAPSPSDAPSDPREDPWVQQSLALWARSRDATGKDPSTLASAVLGFVMQPFYLGGTITLEQALAFLGQVEPRPPASALADAADLMRRAEVAPAADDLLRALAARHESND